MAGLEIAKPPFTAYLVQVHHQPGIPVAAEHRAGTLDRVEVASLGILAEVRR